MQSSHFTLGAASVKTVTLAADASQVEVVNVDGGGRIYFTVDGSTPTVGGDNTYVLPAAIGSLKVPAPATSGATVVRLIASGASLCCVADVTEP